MKTSLLTAALFLCVFCSLQAQVVYIPDVNFLKALINNNVDANNNGVIEVSEAQVVNGMSVYNASIKDMTGIEAFVNLTHLYCYSNQLTSLDLSKNTALYELDCYECSQQY